MSLFVFDRYEADNDATSVAFYYRIALDDGSEHTLCERLVLPVKFNSQSPLITKILQALHIGLGISYYKTFLPPTFELPYKLSQTEADFWNHTYLNGLAEFLYVNDLSPERIAKFSGTGVDEPAPDEDVYWTITAIVGIGGGKDSIVAGELLKAIDVPVTGFILATGDNHGQSEEVALTMGVKTLGVQRHFDRSIIKLQQSLNGYNGHVPISMVFALVGTLLCAATGNKYMVVANESSANDPNTEWHGMSVNHQWSKTFEFELLFHEFVAKTITPNIEYFSAIRPLSSVGVMNIFANLSQYFDKFTSCNLVFRMDPAARPNGKWCGTCAKCLSSYIMLSPWVAADELRTMFGKEMLDDESLAPMLLELLGVESHKPLDCVGTIEEITASLNTAVQQGKFTDSPLVAVARERGAVRDGEWQEILESMLEISDQHQLPQNISDQLMNEMANRLQP